MGLAFQDISSTLKESGSRQEIGFFQKLLRDPRHFQILTLSSLLAIQFTGSDFAPPIEIIFMTLGGCLFMQLIFSKIFSVPLDFRSPLISGLSLSILFKASALWFFGLVAVFTIASKFLIRFRGKHVFNPTNFGIVLCLLVLPHDVWVSTGQWGREVWLLFFLSCMGLLVLYQIPRRDMGPMFLACWAALLFGRALWLGDPMSIPLHQIQSGALLIFCFFMISDPKTIPNRFLGRFIFAMIVAVIAFILQFEFFNFSALFYALAIGSLFTPLIDTVLPGKAYQWGDRVQESKSQSQTFQKEGQLCKQT